MEFRKLNIAAWLAILTVTISACNLGATPAPAQDLGAIQTEAFNLVFTQVAIQQTQTAAAIPPTQAPPTATNTPAALPTFAPVGGSSDPFASATPFGFVQQASPTPLLFSSPTPASLATITTKNGCNNGAFLGETAPFDGAEFWPSQPFDKAWTILNTGECTWDEGYVFAFMPQYSTPEGIVGYDIVLSKDPKDHTKPNHSQTFIVKLKAPKTAGVYIGAWKMRDDGGNYFGPLVYVKIKVLPLSQKP